MHQAIILKKGEAELRDKILFQWNESSHLGDCPICFLPMPLDEETFVMTTRCCFAH